MRTIAVVNQKGGCGKTTTVINLAAFLALEARKTLIVDMDPQGHSTIGLLTSRPETSTSMYDVLVQHVNGRETTLPDVIRPVHSNLDLAPADILLSAFPERLAGVPNRERLLREILAGVRERYDYVLIDCPPQVGFLTFNALTACTEAIVPVDPSFFSLHGIGKLLETIDLLARKTGHEILVRALVTLYVGRSRFANEVVGEIRQHLGNRCFNTLIRHSVKLAEAASHALPIAAYCRRCAGFEDYEALAGEVLAMEGSRPVAEAIHPSAPLVTRDGVLFTCAAPGARRVQLVGDFNGWAPGANDMTPAGDVWTSLVNLPPGRYQYLFVVDGEWRIDPLNAQAQPSPYGGQNSVLIVDEDPRSEMSNVA